MSAFVSVCSPTTPLLNSGRLVIRFIHSLAATATTAPITTPGEVTAIACWALLKKGTLLF